jgi:hypothetical protein
LGQLKRTGNFIDEDPDEAYRICIDRLRDNPDDAKALFVVGYVNATADRHGAALPVFEKVVKLAPKWAEAHHNLGRVNQECGRYKEAREGFRRAFELAPKATYASDVAATYLNECNYSEAARWCRRAFDIDPNNGNAMTVWGFVNLAQGNWAEGWKGYDYSLGGRFRKEVKLGNEPRWNGEYVENLFVYGEQGIGDEIMYASCLGDLQGKVGHVTLECDPRLGGLFKRSFPGVEVHGTRRAAPDWVGERRFDAGCGVGQLPRFFRPSSDDCPKAPYLVPDAERRVQWRALFDTWGKPVIGIAWSGGRANTQRKERAVGLEAFRSYIERTDAVFVSLQYTDAAEEVAATGLPVRIFDRATRSPDFDDTAAFVAELDYVIGPPTTIHHVAGGLGKPSTILVPSRPMWDVAHGDRLPWYEAQVFHRQRSGESWADCVKRLPDAARSDWLRSEATSGVQRSSTLDHPAREPADQYLPVGALATADQA